MCAAVSRLKVRSHSILASAGALGGRLDHTLSSLSTLHKNRDMDIVLWGEGNMAQLLPMGKHIIHPWPQIKGASCGLVPLAGPATVTSTGLQCACCWLVSRPTCCKHVRVAHAFCKHLPSSRLLRAGASRVGALGVTAITLLGFAKLNLMGPGITPTVKKLWRKDPK